MKRTLLLLAALTIVLLIAGCASSPTPEQAPSDIPGFYLNPPTADDAIYGVGSAKMSKLDTSRRMAIARAREDIAFQMQATIQSAITDYAQEAGVDDNTQVISFVETISRQVTDTTLSGAVTEEVAQGSDGTIYALVSYPKANYLEAAGEAFQRNEDAAFAEFKADQALERLQSDLDNNPPKAGNTTEG